ncbi:MAG: energy transducer TonB, partial [Gammaproteobacteria bacterium]|nr:energy transducer TonB [Gammaproteobacteria bacterium]
RGYTEETLNRPPDHVRVLTEKPAVEAIINDRGVSQFNGEKWVQVRGFPFQFILEQLHEVLPVKYRNAQQLSALSITLSFTVLDDGSTANITVTESNAPSTLERVIVTALKESHFRPAFKEGRRVKTDAMILTQTFR